MATSEGTLEVRILGSFEVLADGEPVPLGPPKQRALLARLVLSPGELVAADRLIEDIWGGEAPARAPHAVQVYVSALRKALGRAAGRLETRRPGYCLQLADGELDADRFGDLAERGRAALAAGSPAGAAATLREALALWRGAALSDFRYEPFAQAHAARLDELRLACLEDRLEADLETGSEAEAVAELESLVGEHPLRERLRGQLMLALYRSGRQAEALEAYQLGRDVLVEELGVEPSPELQAVHRAILNQDDSLNAPSVGTPSTNVPEPLTSLFGRTVELAELHDLMQRDGIRLVTLTGPGGTGKTRLALATAATLADDRYDGVWFVDLSALRDPTLVMSTIATTVAGRETLDGALAGKRALIVLDNFEQLLPAAVDVVAMLRAERGVKILVTSREPLRVEGEHEYPVQPLPETDAVALFVDRARSLVPTFEPDENVAAICRRVDGLPLAIQLAAARTKVLTPVAILERLDGRLTLLTQGSRDLPERQRTLRATIAWSYELLDDDERRAFEALGAFAGRFSVGAAEEVAEVDLDLLGRLVDKSLVRPRGDGFVLLDTIREYAVERLETRSDSDALRRRHADFWIGVSERAADELDGANQRTWLAELDLAHADLRSALAWTLDHDLHDRFIRLATALAKFWTMHGHFAEGRRWMDHAVRLEPVSAQRAKVLLRAGLLASDSHDLEAAEALYAEAMDIIDIHGDPTGDVLSAVLNNLGVVRLELEDYEASADVLRHSLRLAKADDDEVGIASATHNLGIVALAMEDYERARALFEESLVVARQLNHQWGCSITLQVLGATLAATGDTNGAATALSEALTLARDIDHPAMTADIFEDAAAVAAARGDPATGARLLGAAAALRARIGVSTEPVHARRLRKIAALVDGMLDDEDAERARSEGGALDLEAATAQALDVLA